MDIDKIAMNDDGDWWETVQTFDFGIGVDVEKEQNEAEGRFAEVTEEAVKSMVKKKNAARTEDWTKSRVKILQDYCSETGIPFPTETTTPGELNSILGKFYIAVRTKKGEMYKLNSMKSIRFALQRHFSETNKIDIIEHDELIEANQVFKNVLKNVKTAGKGDTTHYPEIEPEDLMKLHAAFDVNTPAGLQELCWFSIMFYLIRRGRENVRAMTKSTFKIASDATGKRYIYQTTSEITKNHNENDHTNDTNGEGRIYATGASKCPVACFEKYLRVLNPNIEALWQRPRAKISIRADIWYCNVPLGEKTLGGMLPMLSEKYNLSQRYTNHSLRVTSIQVLEDANVETRHIVRVSGHKNVESVSNYARRLSASKKRNLSSILAESVGARPAAVGQMQVKEQHFEAKYLQTSDDIEKVMQNIPQQFFNPQVGGASSSCLNIVPGSFTPFISNCSNFTFNVYTGSSNSAAKN